MPISINNLTMEYKKGVYALDNVSLEIGNGMFGLLGQNGAGKTTLMRIITTILRPTSGEVIIDGIKLSPKSEMKIKDIIGYLPQEFCMYPGLTVYEALDYVGILNKINTKEKKYLINGLLEKVNLQNERGKKVKHLSGGMKRRLGIAQALLNSPRVLIVDEPTAGLDPEERVRIRNMLNEFGRDKTVILSTHIVEDVASTCKNLAILEKGKFKFNGTVKEMIEKAEGKVWICNVPDNDSLNKLKDDYIVLSNIYLQDRIEVRLLSDTQPHIESEIVPANIEDAYILVSKKGG